jgi:hypothetical protein
MSAAEHSISEEGPAMVNTRRKGYFRGISAILRIPRGDIWGECSL